MAEWAGGDEEREDDDGDDDEPVRKLQRKSWLSSSGVKSIQSGRKAKRASRFRKSSPSACSPRDGWDARTVTHIMGLRAFSSQVLCEQVVGRGLRRVSYDSTRTKACSMQST